MIPVLNSQLGNEINKISKSCTWTLAIQQKLVKQVKRFTVDYLSRLSGYFQYFYHINFQNKQRVMSANLPQGFLIKQHLLNFFDSNKMRISGKKKTCKASCCHIKNYCSKSLILTSCFERPHSPGSVLITWNESTEPGCTLTLLRAAHL